MSINTTSCSEDRMDIPSEQVTNKRTREEANSNPINNVFNQSIQGEGERPSKRLKKDVQATVNGDFAVLPFEIIQGILCDYDLPLKDWGNCQKVCRLFNVIVTQAEENWEKYANVFDPKNKWKSIKTNYNFTWKKNGD